MRSPISSPNAISPEIMTAAERLDEVGAILAAGILRLRDRRRARAVPAAGQNRAAPQTQARRLPRRYSRTTDYP